MARKGKPAKPEKPELFVGSSAEAKLLANSIVQTLRHDLKVTPWTAGVFTPSSSALRDLIRQAGKTAYSVFIFAPDDKVTSRGAQYEAARDNVIFELGLFMGKLGPENCFVLVPKNRRKLKIPSDLEGFSLINYEDDRMEENSQAAVAGACADINAEINRRGREAPAVPAPSAVSLTPPTPSPTPSPPSDLVALHVQDLLGMMHKGAAGLEVVQRDADKFALWARNALHMARIALQAITPSMPADAYVAWLRPQTDDRERITFYLGENTPSAFAVAHHPFTLGEALAGSVWQNGVAASHSAAQPHPKWKVRADCKNASYICVPVGRPAGPGGVLGFGSDQGFETNSEQVSVLETFAAVLAVATGQAAWWDPEESAEASASSPSLRARSRGRRPRSTE